MCVYTYSLKSIRSRVVYYFGMNIYSKEINKNLYINNRYT